MDAVEQFRKRFSRTFRKVFQDQSRKIPVYLEMGDAGFIDWQKAAVGQLNQAREHQKRLALKALDCAIDAMMRANLAHVVVQTRLKQDEYEGLPFPPDADQ